LPDLSDRAFVIAPSVSAWFHRGPPTRPSQPRRIGVAVGPGLPGAEREGRLVAELHADADVLLGADASVEATLALLRRCDLVHLAAHGRFRNDSPLFSSVELNDGSLTVVDLDMLGGVADTIVLPVCNAATASVRAGDELIGPTAALLRLGVRTVVAPGRPIPDEASVDVMLRFHRLLISGSTAAEALAALRSGSPDEVTALAAGLLNCFGAD
jgi:CHAT domain-containing protein